MPCCRYSLGRHHGIRSKQRNFYLFPGRSSSSTWKFIEYWNNHKIRLQSEKSKHIGLDEARLTGELFVWIFFYLIFSISFNPCSDLFAMHIIRVKYSFLPAATCLLSPTLKRQPLGNEPSWTIFILSAINLQYHEQPSNSAGPHQRSADTNFGSLIVCLSGFWNKLCE